MKKVLFAAACIFLLASCGQNKEKNEKLQAENDSIKLESAKSAAELDEILSILNEVETSFERIRDAENYLSTQQNTQTELTPSRKEELKNNMQLVTETLQNNKKQLAKLQAQLDNSTVKSGQLKKTIDRLAAEIEQKASMIVTLQEDLTKKNIRIQELDDMVTILNEDVENFAITTMAQAEKINNQDKALHTAYYCFGTAKELKNQKILSGGSVFAKSKVLQPGFNKEYFITIDTREIKEIPLFTNKAKLKSSHPEGSYEFIEDDDKNVTLKILNTQTFWSISKYLVIEVK